MNSPSENEQNPHERNGHASQYPKDIGHGGEGGIVRTRAGIKAVMRHAARFPLSESEMSQAVDWVMKVGQTAQSKRTKLSAAMALTAMVRANTAIDAVDIADRRADLQETSLLRDVLKNPEAREALAKLTDKPE